MEWNAKNVFKVMIVGILIIITLVVFINKEDDDIMEVDYGAASPTQAGVSVGDSKTNDDSTDTKNDDAVAETIYVDVSGEVNNAKVVELDQGSRVFQAVDKAGGLTGDAVTKYMNMAAILSDGDKIYVPSHDETQNYDAAEKASAASSIIGGKSVNTTYSTTSESGDTTENASSEKLININTADSEMLQTLTGIGPSTAQKIIDYRKQNGAFKSVEELTNISGIGPKTLEKFIDKICV